jgi:uncharacterized protein YbjT (DUF2867 family)
MKDESGKIYLVTGATGNVGSEVVAQLLASGKKVRVFTRDASKVTHWDDRVEVAAGDFQKPDTFAHAVAGVEAAFLMNGSPDAEAFGRLISTARAGGDPRVVFLSTILAEQPQSQIGKLHRQKEDLICKSGLSGKFVRPGGFMTNCYQWIGTIKAEGVVYNATGNGKSAPIAPEDIAAVAVRALTDPDLSGEVFELTGSKLLDAPEQVRILAKVLGKPIRCIDVPAEAAVRNLIRAGIPAQIAAAVGQSFEAIRAGRAAAITDTVEKVTGRQPETFESWARKHISRFA